MDKSLKYMSIYNHFLSLIHSGVMGVGDRLPTEEQVAAQFGVSRITVIRALKQLQSDGFIERMQGSGSYVRDRSVSHGGLKVVSLIIAIEGQGREIQLIEGIEKRLKQSGYLLSVSNSRQSAEAERELVAQMKNEVQGMIVYSVSGMDNNSLFEGLMREHWPVVYIDRYPMNVPCSYAACDNFSGGYQIGKFFLEQGHRHIALIYHDIVSISSERDRFNGFMKAMGEGNIPRNNIKIISISRVETTDTIARMVGELYGRDPDSPTVPTALFTFNDSMALMIMDYMSDHPQYALPGNFVLAGFDDLRKSEYPIPFVTIRQNYLAIGEKAADILITKMESGSLYDEQAVIPVELVKYGCK